MHNELVLHKKQITQHHCQISAIISPELSVLDVITMLTPHETQVHQCNTQSVNLSWHKSLPQWL